MPRRPDNKHWSEILSDGLDNFTVKIDEADASTTYIGKANFGVAVTEPYWQIQKISVSGTVTTIAFADGEDKFLKVWNDRATYSYS